MSSPPMSYFLLKAAGAEKGSSRPGHSAAGTVTLKHVYEIAKIKSADPNFKNVSLESVCRTVVGAARSLGIRVVR